MPRNTMTFFLCTLIALGAGAAGSRLTRSNGGVAVVDLDRVAKELGRDVQMLNDLRANQNDLAGKLSAIEKSAVAQLNELKSGLGESPEREQLQEFAQKKQTAQVNLGNLQKQAVTAIGQRRDQLVANFRQEARPVVERIAKSQGANAVITRNETILFSFDNTIDITDAVVAEMRLAPPAAAPPLASASPVQATAQSSPAGPVRQASASTTKPTRTRAAAPKTGE